MANPDKDSRVRTSVPGLSVGSWLSVSTGRIPADLLERFRARAHAGGLHDAIQRLSLCRATATLNACRQCGSPMKKTKTWIILLLAAGALAAAGWHFRPQAPAAPAGGARRGGGPGGSGGPPTPVVAGPVAQKDVPIYLDGLGTVQAFNSVTVRARVDGELQKIAFTEGQDVKKGDLLAVIDPRSYQAQVDQAAAKKAQDEAQLANARLVLSRNEDLIKKRVLDQQSFDASKFNVDQLAAGVQGDQAALDNARTQLSYTQILAPIDGRVGVRQVDQGNIIRAADANGIVVITQLKPISVLFTLPESNLLDIRQEAAKGTLRVTAMDRANVHSLGEGELAVVDNQIDQTTATARLKATFPNADLSLWPGQFVNARLLLTTRKDGVVVPASVVQRGPSGTYAFVINADRTVEMRTIKVARTDSGQALIEDGLTPGEQVVIDGQYKLQPGAKVDPSGGKGPPGPEGSPQRRGSGNHRALGQASGGGKQKG
jgi:multidrug efflux system membrane fusion protein